ncbi:voltage-gated sodium channel [Aureococcus anophagefferens]|uniref:Voltage-gated sodium channel n=1 Tax=Aureococcus anophagefferens TaxID=44056 RepID=A0ABR1FLH4_AURAN
MAKLLALLQKTLGDVANIAGILMLFMYICALLGMQLFANRFRFDGATGFAVPLAAPGSSGRAASDAAADVPRAHFDDLGTAFVTIFQILTGENWNTIFLAILLSNIMTVHEPETRDRSDTGREKVKAAQASRLADEERRKREAAEATGLRRRALESALQRSDSIFPLPDIRALGCLGPDNEFRLRVALLVDHPRFDQVILLLILVSTAFLAIDSPLNAPCSTLSLFLALSDWFFTPIFIMEMVLKVIAVGAAVHRKRVEPVGLPRRRDVDLRPHDGRADAHVHGRRLERGVAQGAAGHARVQAPPGDEARGGPPALIDALLGCIPSVLEVCAVCMLFFLVFAIFLVSFLKGRLRHCGDARFWEASEPPTHARLLRPELGRRRRRRGLRRWRGGLVRRPVPVLRAWPPGGGWNATVPTAKELCRCWGYRWTPVVSQSFDNVFVATLSLFEMATTEGWIGVMYAAVDSTGSANMPRRDENPGWYAVFLIFMLVGSFLFLNLFVGVVCDSFEKMRGDKGGDILLAVSSTPALGFVAGEAFDNVIGGCILLNGVSLALPYFGQPDGYTLGTYVLGHCFSFIFFVEMVLKLLAFGTAYFTSNWNRFDFGLVTITLVGLPLEFTGSGASGIGGFARMLRLARTVRLARLIKRHKTMQKLCLTTGTGSCATSRGGPRRADDPEYDDDVCAFNGDAPGCVPVDGCGSTLIYPYLLSFSIVVAFVFVNLFIGVVLEGFNSADADDDLMISDEDYQRFRDGWAKIQSLELEIFELGEQDMDEGDEGEAARVKFNDAILALAKHAHDTIVKVGSSSSTGAKRTALLRCFTEELVRGRGSSVDGRFWRSRGAAVGVAELDAARAARAGQPALHADEAPDPPVGDGRVDLSYGGAALDGHAVARVLANCRFELDLSENAFFEGDARKALTALRALAKTMDDADGRMALALQCCGLGEAANSPDGPLAAAALGTSRADLEVLNLSDNNLGPRAVDPLASGIMVRFFDADAPRSRRSSRLRCDLGATASTAGSDATRPLYDILQKSWDRDDLPSHWVKLEDDGDDFYAPPPATPLARARPRS